MHKFSVPMPLEKTLVDKLCEINDEVEKSKITNVYFALPNNCSGKSTFEQSRFDHFCNTNFDYWKLLIEYTLSKGFDFIYILNHSRSFMPSEDFELPERLRKLDSLLNNLRSVGVNKVRLANTQVIDYIANNYPDFKIYTSTMMEYNQMKQYQNYLAKFPQTVQMVGAIDINKNFLILKNIKQMYPNLEIELMVDEGCLGGCPFKMHHNFAISYYKPPVGCPENFSARFFIKACSSIYIDPRKYDFFEHMCKSNIIYPWEIEEYSKIGIDNFKLVGRNTEGYINGKYYDYYKTYLKGVDNWESIADEPLMKINHRFVNSNLNLTIGDVKPFLPDIQHFIKHGHLCASSCGVTCRYCYECAAKLRKELAQKIGNKRH